MTCGIFAACARDRADDVRMVVAVARRPPARDAVDQFAPVGQHDPRAARQLDSQRRPRRLHLRVGQPDMRQARRRTRMAGRSRSNPIRHGSP